MHYKTGRSGNLNCKESAARCGLFLQNVDGKKALISFTASYCRYSDPITTSLGKTDCTQRPAVPAWRSSLGTDRIPRARCIQSYDHILQIPRPSKT